MTGIYYADLFVINGKGCVVMGCGKSQTCRSYTAWILGNVTRIPRHELPQTLDFSDFLPLFT